MPEGEGRKQLEVEKVSQPVVLAINYKVALGSSESAHSWMRNNGDEKRSSGTRRKVVQESDECREQGRGRRLKRGRGKQRQSSWAEADYFIGSLYGARGRREGSGCPCVNSRCEKPSAHATTPGFSKLQSQGLVSENPGPSALPLAP